MTTITLKVEKVEQAKILVSWLNAIKFIKNISLTNGEKNECNFSKINEILSSIEPQKAFNNISNPIEFQKQLRNEW